ncbi:MAG: RNA polymerase factor sigma-32 [Rickettsiales bacterium]|nr:RNA polymerase factor sigma-32 [Rickettsiales bacterium]
MVATVQNNSFEIAKLDSLKNSDSGFLQYVKKIQTFPILSAKEEYDYGMKYINEGDKEAAKMLVQSHLRLVVKMASKFKNYGLPVIDLVSEGNLGLIQAVKKFNPEKGFRFSTYAMWWIRAYMQDYILKSWSLVKIGTTAAQKKLFFNLHKIKKKINAVTDKALSLENVAKISNDLNVSQKEVIEMDSRLTQGDSSLNKVVGDDEDGREIGDMMVADQPSQEELVIQNQEMSRQKELFVKAFKTLNDREKDILTKRQLSETSMTLEELSQIYKVSRERIRQIEENAIKKIKKLVAA